jgi:V/A-type H+/Na+-transporting ATPase subunit I
MRVDLKKFLFMGLKTGRLTFFQKAQDLGIIHFISLTPSIKEIPADVNNISNAIKILRSFPPVDQEESDDYLVADSLSNKIIELKHRTEKLAEELRVLKLEIERVEGFGNFSLEDLSYIEKEGKRKIQFFCAKQGFAENKGLPDELIYVGTEFGLDCFVAINKEAVQYPKMVEVHIKHPVGELRKIREATLHELHETEQHLKTFAKYNTFLHHALVHKLNGYHLYEAEKYAQPELEGELFAVEGWVPVTKLNALKALVDQMQVHDEEIAIDSKEIVPTALENQGISRLGEDLVHIYDTPSHTDKDPSLWLLVFFALFFAMIIGDAGYGFIFLGVALYIRYKYKVIKGVGLRVWKLFLILALACIGWGVLTHSFFGYQMTPENPLRKISLLNWLVEKKAEYHFEHHDVVYDEWLKEYPNLKTAKTGREFLLGATKETLGEKTYPMYNKFADNIMMELALVIGMIHICLSFLRYAKRNWQGIGWVIFIIGAYLYAPSYLGATTLTNFVFGLNREVAAHNGIYLMIAGLSLAIILSLILNKFLGLLEITNIIQVFADILSYLRLYALGLAGAMVMATINEFAHSLPLLLGALLFLFGHITNMALGVMGGIIHGLRLNFIEWYHYSFEGGGKVYNPLRKLKID